MKIKSRFIELQPTNFNSDDIIINHKDRTLTGKGKNINITGQIGFGHYSSVSGSSWPGHRYGHNGGDVVISGGSGKSWASGIQAKGGGNGGDLILKGGALGTKGDDVTSAGGATAVDGLPGNVVIDSSSNLLFGMPDTDLDFTMKMPRSTVGDDAKILKIEGQHAAASGSFNGGNIEITAGAGHRSNTGDVYGGNVIISGGDFTSDTTTTGTGRSGYVHIKKNPIIQDFTYFNGTYANLTGEANGSTSTGVKQIPVEALVGGLIRISSIPSTTTTDIYFPTATQINNYLNIQPNHKYY